MGIDLTVVGPEAPLAAGIVDHFSALGIPIFGPSGAAAKIESSKVFSKQLMQKYGIPCPRGAIFSDYKQAREYLEAQSPPMVVKADGLAAGKGVTVATSKEEAQQALSDIMETKAFGTAGDSVIIEECLVGKEVSLLAFTDGKTVIPMVPACDYKRAFDSDKGPNTGGMGSYSPPGFFDAALTRQVVETILKPTVEALAKEGAPYKGVLYAGLMLAADGPKVLEFNARFGDPETQVILPRLKSDLVDIILAIV
jgi:phosphoribosylamine--glycine ligase